MNFAAWTIAGACALDALLGDPVGLPHPVRFMGAAIDFGDRRLNAGGRGTRVAGAALALIVIGAAATAGMATRRSRIASIVLGASSLAARDLFSEVGAVAGALGADDLTKARSRVSRIVGRDTADLDPTGVARAAIETLGESACDGIVAPLFWLVAGGVPGALAFKAASTLDSMIGHREPRYLRFGAFAARTDDALNFVPARITALLIAFASGRPVRVARIALRDAPKHASPNAGWPEAALAAALGVCLGGANSYDGLPSDGPLLNDGARRPNVDDVYAALQIIRRVTLLGELCAIAARA